MKVQPLACFVCPLDGAPLEPADNALRCAGGHSFDRAREGYFNLLPVQHKASRDPGDDQTMVTARRRILDDGLFKPLADAVFAPVRAAVGRAGDTRPVRVVDAGCGEGYYLAQLRDAARQCADAGELELAGYDISKWAVRAAARRSSAIAWAVASNRQPPLPSASIDLILSLFGFPHWPSFEAILAPRGRVLSVDAGSNHLLELRKVIYPRVQATDAALPDEPLMRDWRMVAAHALEYSVLLDTPAQIQCLVAMTPHAHRMSADGRLALAALTCLRVTMSMVLREWEAPD